MHGQLDDATYHVTVSGSRRGGHIWRLLRGPELVASAATNHPSPEDAEADATAFRRLAKSAGYDVVRAGEWWTWRAWHNGVVRARGVTGYATEQAARAAAHEVRDTAEPGPAQ
jgi:hypothetical protein